MRHRLTWYELALAASVGVRRKIESLRERRHNANGYEGGLSWDVDIEGAAAEMAVAKALGQYWGGGVDTFREPDVGKLQVRHTIRPDGHLIIRPGDRDDDCFVLVTGRAPEYEIVGWIKAGEARRPEWLRTQDGRPPAHFVPADALASPEFLAVWGSWT